MINIINNLFNKVNSISSVSNNYNNNHNKQTIQTEQIKNNKSNEIKSFKEILGDQIFISEEGRQKVEENKQKELEGENNMCNHNPNDENTSLEKMNKRIMVTPTIYWYTCNTCHKGFMFVKNVNGELIEIEQNENNQQ